MRFKDFILIEMGDITNADTSLVKIEPERQEGEPDIFISKFKDRDRDGEDYTVEFKPYEEDNSGLMGVDINFFGPNGLLQTNKGIATEVYSKLLLVIKKYIEDYQPGFLKFVGATSEMDLMYATFANKYLQNAPGKDRRFVFFA